MVVKELFARLGLEVDAASFERAESMLHSLVGGWKGVALGAAAAVGAMVEVARETAEAGEKASHAAQRLGITTDAYQELAHAAYMADVSQEGLETALFRMSRAAQEAKMGSTEAGLAFKGLLTIQDLKTLKPDEMLSKLADGFVGIKDQGQRAQKIMAIFGRGGAELIPLLNQGAAGIAKFKAKAHELGVVLSEEDIKNSEEFNDRAKEMSARLIGLRNAIGTRVIPILLHLGDWMSKHREQLMTLARVVGIMATLYAGYWLIMEAQAIASAAMIAGAWILANLPILAIIASLAVVALWLEDLYQLLTGGESVIGDFVATIKDSMVGGIKQLLLDLFAWIAHFFPDSFSTAAGDAAAAVVEKLTDAWRKVRHAFAHPIDTVFGSSSPAPAAGGFGGGASSPDASVLSSPSGAGAAGKVVSVNAPNTITINTHPGMTADEIVGAMDRKISEHHEKVNRETEMAAP